MDVPTAAVAAAAPAAAPEQDEPVAPAPAEPAPAAAEQPEQPAEPVAPPQPALPEQVVPEPPVVEQPQVRPPLPAPRPTPRPSPAPAPAADGLFAPSVPAIGDPRQGDGLDMGETTPIFEEIASAWFRSNRPIPVDWESTAAAGPALSGPSALEAPIVPGPAGPPSPVARPAAPTPEPAVAAAPAAPAPTEQDFASAADEGWRAASEVVTEHADELTSAGLPKRRPRARLVPGSAGSAVLAAPATAARSAETIRGRLASYQQGIRQGRESRMRGDNGAASETNGGSGTGPAGDAGGNHDEESS
ncbi:hypothetical protein BJF78_12970 [Pseudonocardia sp. CNS-139]|nr:hypothetical protein BJF78_12970 [Pseudonocardia sp. CNS-139]